MPEPGQVQTSNNGHKQPPQPFGDAWGFGESGGVAKYFVTHGDEFLDALMRCKFEDKRDEVATLGLARKCLFFEDEEGLQGVLMKVVANNSVGAEQLKLLVHAITGIPPDDNRQSKIGGFVDNVKKHIPRYGQGQTSDPQDRQN